MEKSALITQSDQQNFQNVNNREVIIIEHIQTQQEYLNKPSNLKKVPGSIWLSTSGQPIYLSPDICHFFIYRHRPISVISSADLKSDTSAGSAVLLVRWNVRCCCMWRTPSQNFWNIPCLPVLSTPLYVCYVWAGWWLISLVLVTKWQ